MIYSKEVENMCSVCKGAYHGPAPIPEEGKWVAVKEIKEISGRYHPGGSRRDHRLHRYDSLCRYGF